VWEGFVAAAAEGDRYKYHIDSRVAARPTDKADPFARRSERPPATASVLWRSTYTWGDSEWMTGRAVRNALGAPWSIYEVHAGSWMRPQHGGHLSYGELAPPLADHVTALGFTHVEFLPLMEHPYYGSWGYQVTGYFSPTARYGTPDELKGLIDALHRRGIGVILDWVPSHFPTDEHGLGLFDGTHLYEHADPRRGFHPDWTSYIFDYGRPEVRSFLLSSALYWLEEFHADGLRVDGVSSMLYLDYSRAEGEWLPNEEGGRENLDAVATVRLLNERAYGRLPDVQMIAEESTAWPGVSHPTDTGGLGFGLKWDLGWMHDTLGFLARDPADRESHHERLTFRSLYAFSENFVLPLSHDEVVHGKGSLLAKMPGERWQRFAGLRLLLGYMYGLPGKKLLFMGGELGQPAEWDHESEVAWELRTEPAHAGIMRWVADLNRAYAGETALHELDCESDGFAWIEPDDAGANVLAWLRRSRAGESVLVACNFSLEPRAGYRFGCPLPGRWEQILNSDAEAYGGSGPGSPGGVVATPREHAGWPNSLSVTLPPLGVLFLKREETSA